MGNRNLLLGIAALIGGLLLLGGAFRAGQASVMFGDGRFDDRGREFDRESFDRDSFDDRAEVADDDEDDDDDERDERGRDGRDGRHGHGKDGHGRGHGHGHGHGRHGGGFIGGILGFLARIAVLAGVVWAVINWNQVQSWWNNFRNRGGTATVNDDPEDDPIPPSKEAAVVPDAEADETPAKSDE